MDIFSTYEDLPAHILTEIRERYPIGFQDHIIPFSKEGITFYGLIIEYGDNNYFIQISNSDNVEEHGGYPILPINGHDDDDLEDDNDSEYNHDDEDSDYDY